MVLATSLWPVATIHRVFAATLLSGQKFHGQIFSLVLYQRAKYP